MILHGDCLEKLKTLDENSVDSVITDPPAGISFMGKSWDDDKGGRKQWCAWMQSVMEECLRVLKPGGHALVWAIPRTSHWTATAVEDAGFEIRDVVTHLFGSGFPKSLDISKAIDKEAGAKREELGPNPNGRVTQQSPGEYITHAYNPLTAPSTDAAKQWQGFGTALKPAAEFWILARKPISEKTVAKNVLKWGTGGLNIDASRIGLNGEKNPSIARYESTPQIGNNGWEHANRGANFNPDQASLGRFPANLVLSGDAPEMLDEQSGMLKSGQLNPGHKQHGSGQKPGDKYSYRADGIIQKPYGGDSGGASRFFYCSKVSASERGEDNKHPTVKPQKLMTYLIKLITPPGGTVLDPFAGSGSTLVAAKKAGFKFIGIEKELEYFAIAKKRIEATV